MNEEALGYRASKGFPSLIGQASRYHKTQSEDPGGSVVRQTRIGRVNDAVKEMCEGFVRPSLLPETIGRESRVFRGRIIVIKQSLMGEVAIVSKMI